MYNKLTFYFSFLLLILAVGCTKENTDLPKSSTASKSYSLITDSEYSFTVENSDYRHRYTMDGSGYGNGTYTLEYLSLDSISDDIDIILDDSIQTDSIVVTDNGDSTFYLAYNGGSYNGTILNNNDDEPLKILLTNSSSSTTTDGYTITFDQTNMGSFLSYINGGVTLGVDELGDADFEPLCPPCAIAIWAIAGVVVGLVESHCNTVMLEQAANCAAIGMCIRAGTCEVNCVTCDGQY